MSSDTTVPSGTVTRCGWPECPSGFTTAPMAKGWTRIPLSALGTDIKLILCPFHAVGHLPHMVVQGTRVRMVCSCQELIPCEQDTASAAYLDWREHARAINGADELDTCEECLRGFTPSTTGNVRKHNAWDKMNGRLLSSLCPGAGRPPLSRERP